MNAKTSIRVNVVITTPRTITGSAHPELKLATVDVVGSSSLALEVPLSPADAGTLLQDLVQSRFADLLNAALLDMDKNQRDLSEALDSTYEAPVAPAPVLTSVPDDTDGLLPGG